MDRYKQSLCLKCFGGGEEDILRRIIENKQGRDYEYNLNADGKLHSRYLEEFGCYEPAIIRRSRYSIRLYWLFDGEIKNHLHPFTTLTYKETNVVREIEYYSLERIQQLQPIYLKYLSGGACIYAAYNRIDYEDFVIINDPNIPSYTTREVLVSYNKVDMSQFVAIAPDIICPLWSDEFASDSGLFKFKFED